MAPELLGLLLTYQRNGAALQLLRTRIQTHANFRPPTGAHALRLAQLARDGGDWPLARLLVDDSTRVFPCIPRMAA